MILCEEAIFCPHVKILQSKHTCTHTLILLQQLLIKPITTRVAGRSSAKGFILLFVVGLKANCCMNTLVKIKTAIARLSDNETSEL